MKTACRTQATKALFLALSLAAASACYQPQEEEPRSAPGKPRGVPTQVKQDEIQTINFFTDVFLPNTPKDRAEQQRLLDERCELWLTYLELGQSAAQRSGDGGRGIVKGSHTCSIVSNDVQDTGRTGEDGEPVRMVQGRLDVQVNIPAGREVKQETLRRFEQSSRYAAWLECHKAASQTHAEAFLCRDNGQQDNDKYVTNLIVLHFRERAQPASK